MASLLPRVEKLEVKVAEHGQKIDEHDRLLIGIPDIPDCPGLVSKVATVEKSIASIEKTLITINVYMKLLAFVGAGIGLSVIGFIWAVITHSVEIIH